MMYRRSTNKNINIIEKIFRHEKQIRETVLEEKTKTHGNTRESPIRRGHTADPTALSAIRRNTVIKRANVDGTNIFNPEEWLIVIDAVKIWCHANNIKREIYKRRYLAEESYIATCQELSIEPATYYYLLNEIRNFALQCAAQMQLIKIFNPYSNNKK